MDVPHFWGHNSETKAQIKHPKTCGPSKWPPLTKGMPYSWVQNVSIEKPQDNRKSGYRNIILEIHPYPSFILLYFYSFRSISLLYESERTGQATAEELLRQKEQLKQTESRSGH